MTIFIQSHRDGFRRCGEVHTRKGREFADDHFTEEQLGQLNADPEITMVAGVVDEDMAAAAGQAIEDGNTISSGAPSVEAIEDILGCSITSEQRDAAWATWKKGNK